MAHVEAGHRTATLCQLCNIGYELRRELTGSGKESFIGDKQANELTDRKRRKKKWYRI